MKRLWFGFLAFTLIFPVTAIAGGYTAPSTEELLNKIDMLSRELEQVKQQLKEVRAQQQQAMHTVKTVKEQQQETMETVNDVSEKLEDVTVNGVDRFNLSGDFRFRLDSARAHVKGYWAADTIQTAMGTMAGYDAASLGAFMSPMLPSLSPALQAQMGAVMAQWDSMSVKQRIGVIEGMMGSLNKNQRIALLNAMNLHKTSGFNPDNDTLYTTRLRFNVKAQATDNINFKGRITMYKIWGMETARATAAPFFAQNGFAWDPNISRRPNDTVLRVETAYVNWTNIADLPIWFSVGRRPTVDGPPLQLKYNYRKRYGTPVALGVDWTFDGATIGYQYFNPWPGKIRVCYGRGFESGFKYRDHKLDDTDLYGISWDVINEPDNHVFSNIQLFKAADVPDFMENTNNRGLPTNATAELGDIYHLSGVYMNRFRGIDWFFSAGVSRTDSRGHGYMGAGLLNNPGEDENHWGWATYVGARVPLEQLSSKVGFEYNYGSRYWINFTPAADDLYLSKLSTRGHVGEIYWIWDIPETPLSKYGRAFIRAGYQYYWINYTGSGSWLGKPIDVDDLDDPMNAQMFMPLDRLQNFYLTFEVYF